MLLACFSADLVCVSCDHLLSGSLPPQELAEAAELFNLVSSLGYLDPVASPPSAVASNGAVSQPGMSSTAATAVVVATSVSRIRSAVQAAELALFDGSSSTSSHAAYQAYAPSVDNVLQQLSLLEECAQQLCALQQDPQLMPPTGAYLRE